MSCKIKDDIIKIMDEQINPGLASHGGYVELNSVEACGDSWEVVFNFMGGCHGCPSSLGYTLSSIEMLLREELNAPTLLVKSSAALY
jgi:Fe-S cluster biogenesis protein NfuA